MAKYIDNAELYQHFVKFHAKCEEAKAAGKERPKIPDPIGKAIYDISHGLGKKRSFAKLYYCDEMISDAIETLVKYIDRFDPAKSQNPFGYITRIVHFSFLQRISKEKRQAQIKRKAVERAVIGAEEGGDVQYAKFLQSIYDSAGIEDQRFEERAQQFLDEAS